MRYKTGDKVKIIATGTWSNGPKCLGKIATVSSMSFGSDDSWDGTYILNENEWCINFKEEWLEPIGDITYKEPQIGDKFRVIKDYSYLRKDTIVTLCCLVDGICTCGSSAKGTAAYYHFKNELGEHAPMYYLKNSKEDEVEPYTAIAQTTTTSFGNTFSLDNFSKLYDKILKSSSDYQFIPLDPYPHYFYNVRNDTKPKPKEVNNKTMANTFKIGDRVKIIKTNWTGRMKDELGVVGFIKKIAGDRPYHVYDDDNTYHGFYYDTELELISPSHKKGLMKTLSIMAAKLVDADVKAFVQAGILDSELNITEEGKSFVLTQVLNTNKKEYAVEAKKIIAQRKEEECE